VRYPSSFGEGPPHPGLFGAVLAVAPDELLPALCRDGAPILGRGRGHGQAGEDEAGQNENREKGAE